MIGVERGRDTGRFDAAFFLLAGIAAVVLALGQVLPPVGREERS